MPSTKPGESFFDLHVLPCGTVTLDWSDGDKRTVCPGVSHSLEFVNDGQEIFDVGVRPSQEDQL